MLKRLLSSASLQLRHGTASKAFLSSESRPFLKINPSLIQDERVAKIMSISTANKKEELKLRVADAIDQHQVHPTDRGSTGVQIAVITEKINNLARHLASNKKDKHSTRGFQGMVNKRRKLMKYMKRSDFNNFVMLVRKLGLEREATQLGGGRDI